MTKLWGGRFTKPADKTAEGFTSSLAFDRRLYKQDIRGSIAHARMLGKQGIIPAADAATIEQGLGEIEAEIEAGQFPFRQEYEDIHLNIEKRLIEKIGAGRRASCTPPAAATTRWPPTCACGCKDAIAAVRSR